MRPYPYHIREALGMKVLGISGSARKDGNTAIIMNAVLEELKKAGIETELIQFAGAAIQPCRACWACGGGEGCAVRGDAFCDTFEKVVQADGILLGSPVYSANVSANMQAFLERAAVVADQSPGLLKNKVGAAVAAVRRGGALEAVDTMNHFFLNMRCLSPARPTGIWYTGKCPAMSGRIKRDWATWKTWAGTWPIC